EARDRKESVPWGLKSCIFSTQALLPSYNRLVNQPDRKISMKNREISLLLIPLLTAFAFALPMAGQQASQNDTPAPPANSQNVGEKPGGQSKKPPKIKTRVQPPPSIDEQSNAAKLIYQFLGVDSKMCGKNPAAGNYEIRNQYKLEFLVATLPDPVESQLSYLFDRNLDAIQRAIESEDYVLDRFDFHWQERNGNSGAGNNSEKKENQSADE